MDKTPYKEISEKLDIITKLLAVNVLHGKSIKEQVQMLYSFGIKPVEIARMIGKKSATEIAPYLYAKKKGGKNDKEPSKRKD